MVIEQAELMRPKRVHAIGSYGFGNFGDDLFVATLHENAAQLWPNATVETFTPTFLGLYAAGGPVGSLMRVGCAVAGLAWSDTVSLCGGSILEDVRGVSRLRMHALRRRRVEALGVSVGPFKDERAKHRVAHLLAGAKRVVVRDEASVRRMAELNVCGPNLKVGGDLVALSKLVRPATYRSDRVVVCPSAAASTDAGHLADQVSCGLASVSSARGEVPPVTLLALSAHPSSDDVTICDSVSSILSERGVSVVTKRYQDLGLSGVSRLIAESSMVWTQRLHGAVVAYLSEVPFLLVAHHAKCIDFASDIGLKGSLLPPIDGPWQEGVQDLVRSGQLAGLMAARDYRRRAEQAYFAQV